MQPIINQFYTYLKQGRIMGLKCQRCRTFLFPPRAICPKCGSNDLNWAQISGKGKLLFASLGEHRLMRSKYIQGTVKLQEGAVLSGMVIIPGFDWSTPERIWEYSGADIPVVAEIVKNPDDVETVAFMFAVRSSPIETTECGTNG